MADDTTDPIIHINCGGREFWCCKSTLEKLPGTPLAQVARLKESHPNYNPELSCFFFDRSPEAFASVLDYYRTDELHISEIVCGNAMKKELEFWGLSEAEIEPCCWGNYAKFHSHKETLMNLETTFGGGDEVALDEAKALLGSRSSWKRIQSKIWILIEYPSESILAKVLMCISMFMVATSIIETIFESHHWFQVVYIHQNETYAPAPNPEDYKSSISKDSCHCIESKANSSWDDYPVTEPHPYLDVIDDICAAYFLLELLVRLLFAPNKKTFFKSPLNIIDLICIIPQIVSTTIKHALPDDYMYSQHPISEDFSGVSLSKSYSRAGDILKAITILRTVRILRVFKLMKHYSAFKILAYTVKVSMKELLLMVVYLMTLVLIFASVIHYAENDNFHSIPIGFWWALVTMTTVGYGDKYPTKFLGYVVGSICVICGVLVIAFTVPIVVNNFTLYYTHARTRNKLPKNVVLELRKKGGSKRKLSVRTSQNSNNQTAAQKKLSHSSVKFSIDDASKEEYATILNGKNGKTPV